MSNLSSNLRLFDKVAIITGAASGLGRAIALAFAAQGTRLVVCADLQPDALPGIPSEAEVSTHDLISQQHGEGKAVFMKTDVGNSNDVEACVNEAVKRGGRLDVMVNNAGLGVEAVRIHEMSEEIWDKMIVNVRGMFLGCKFACAQFLSQGLSPSGQRGYIVNTASIFGLVGVDGGAVTKTAMTKVSYEDEAENAKKIATTPMGDWGSVNDVARGAVFLASDDAVWITGVALPVDGGYTAQ
ncbi:MAG: hypothetical protein Q9187_008935 [Circinaria calcarea]